MAKRRRFTTEFKQQFVENAASLFELSDQASQEKENV